MRKTITANLFTYHRENVTGCHLAAMTELPLVAKVRGIQLERWKKILEQKDGTPS